MVKFAFLLSYVPKGDCCRARLLYKGTIKPACASLAAEIDYMRFEHHLLQGMSLATEGVIGDVVLVYYRQF